METLEDTELCFPQLLNSSCMKTKRPHSETMLIYILLFFISLLAVFLNLLVIISISHFKQLHIPSNFLLLSLAVSDFIIGLLLLFHIMLIDGCWFLGDLMCTLYQYVDYIIIAVSVETMVLISIDRYVAICYPLDYSTKISRKTVMICVCLCWLCSVIYGSLNLKDNLKQPGTHNSCIGQCVIVLNYITWDIDFIVFFIVPITVIITLYIRVFVAAVSQARAMRSHISAFTQRSVKVTAKTSEIKAARTLGVVIVVFLICFFPYYFVGLTGKETMMSASSSAFVTCLYYFNSCLNPVIYAFLYPWFRKSTKLILTLKILKTDSCKANVL